MITYDYYRIFYYVAQYKSFTKAARALHNNQPNITRCMNNLEQELKCTLFLRSNKGIALTPEGRQLYEHVALAFEQLSIGEEEIRQNGELEHGLVSIGASENALRLILLEKLELFDVYRGAQVAEGKKSVAFSLTLRSADHTLTDKEADEIIQNVLAALEAELGAVLRA